MNYLEPLIMGLPLTGLEKAQQRRVQAQREYFSDNMPQVQMSYTETEELLERANEIYGVNIGNEMQPAN